MIRILIVDDQNLVQQGIKSLLDQDLNFQVIGTVKDGRNAVQQIAQIHPDIVLLDIEMPGMDGITTTKYINRVSPKTKVIILSSHEEKKYVTQALMAGAKGYILKTSLMTHLTQAILAVNNGYSQIDSRLLAKVFDPKNVKVKKTKIEPKNAVEDRDDSKRGNSSQLRPSQEVSQGKTQKERSPNTVRTLETIDSHKSANVEQHETSELIAIKSDTSIQSEKLLSVSPEAKASQLQQNAFVHKLSDEVVLEKIDSNNNSQPKNDYYKTSSHVPLQTPLTTERKKTIKRNSQDDFGLLLKRKTSTIIALAKKLLNNPAISNKKPHKTRSKSHSSKYKTRYLLLKRQKKWYLLWNMSLLVLCLAVVVILST